MPSREIVFGIHAVQSLCKSAPHRVIELCVSQARNDHKLKKIIDAAQKQSIQIKNLDKKAMDELCDGNHQGVVAIVTPGKSFSEHDLYPLLESLPATCQVLVLDGVTDPHNLGACLRSADAAGVAAVVIPKDNSAGLNEVARKVACGAADTVPLVPVTNLARSIKKMQELGFWVTGLAGEAEQNIYEADLTGRRAIVMGAEGSGLRRLTRETCDGLVKIPMKGSVSSLNVSVATGIVLFETLRQNEAN